MSLFKVTFFAQKLQSIIVVFSSRINLRYFAAHSWTFAVCTSCHFKLPFSANSLTRVTNTYCNWLLFTLQELIWYDNLRYFCLQNMHYRYYIGMVSFLHECENTVSRKCEYGVLEITSNRKVSSQESKTSDLTRLLYQVEKYKQVIRNKNERISMWQ